MSHDVSLQSVENQLAMLKGTPIFDIPLVALSTGKLVGNNGDALIRLGAERLFERHRLTFVDDPARAQLLMMGGNGGMLERFQFVPGLFSEYWTRFPDKPLLMLPSTFYFPNRSFTADLPPRSADVTLFCRERVSYDHLLNDCNLPSCCQVFLSHDTAFALEDSPLVRQYRGRPGKHILIVERDDAEHPARFSTTSGHQKSLRQRIPAPLKRPFYPLRAFLFSKRSTPFRDRCEEIIRQQHPDKVGLGRLVRDVSRREFASFEGFCQAIGDAEIVFTSRLHVGIFAALLGKQTYVFAGPYHKIRAIYEHSMTGFENVTLVSGDGSIAGR
jgi:exopolysaccharide biosynthesis predicted pyruvyltransferase EpsI